jgi:hypothetical protein
MDDLPILKETTIFDFISDEKFRQSLTSDYAEITASIESGAWKAVHVLAGSIVEAVLVDYLAAVDYKKKTGKDPLKLELADAIEACKKEGVLSQKAADLSSVVRGFRNLIHPGRVVRLNEKINSKTAMIAKTLVDLVVEEIAENKKEKYGFTADQIANKLEKDSSAISVISHFLKETNEIERLKLVTEVLPKRYFAMLETEHDGLFSTADLEKCFRKTFDTLSAENKKKVTKQFVKILKEESSQRVMAYEAAFFRSSDLEHLDAGEVQLVKDHLISRLEKEPKANLLDTLEGIGVYLEEQDEIVRLTDVLVKLALYGKNELIKRRGRQMAEDLYWEIQPGPDKHMSVRLDEWIGVFKPKETQPHLEVVEGIRASFDLPEVPDVDVSES